MLAAGLVVFCSGLGLRGPWPADEPRFALIAEEMVATGEWLFPHRASEIYAHKPPLFMWSIALGYLITGSMRIAFLLPSILAGLGTLLLVYDLGSRLWHRRAGLGAAVALLTIVQFPLQARTAQIDASLTFWTTLGLYGLCRHLMLGPSWGWWLTGWAAMGLGVLTKGVGFLPLLALFPWAWARTRGWRLPLEWSGQGTFWRWLAGPLLLLVTIGLWLIPMLITVELRGDPELAAYRDEILWGQTVERYASFEGHQQPLGYYLSEAIPILWLPASLFLPWLVPAWVRRLRRRDARHLVLLGWIVLVVTFFTFSSGKRGVYILPAVPALALACGPLVAAGLARLRGPRWAAIGLLAPLSLALVVAALAGFAEAPWTSEIVEKHRVAPWSAVAVLGTAGLVWTAISRARFGVHGLAGFLASLWVLGGLAAYPVLDPARSSALFMSDVAAALGPRAELAMVGWKEQMILQADRPVTHWGYVYHPWDRRVREIQVAAATRWLSEGADGTRAVLMPTGWAGSCVDASRAPSFGRWHGEDWVLVDRSATLGTCRTGAGEAAPSYTTDWKKPS